MNTYNLGGHSGCLIHLIENDNGTTFVRKISKDCSYNDRLKIQCEKQRNYLNGVIKTPEIYCSGYNEQGLFYFDMEYVQGIVLSEYIKSMEIGKISNLVNSIYEHIILNSNNGFNSLDSNVDEVFKEKVSNLRKKLSVNNPVLDRALSLLEKHEWSLVNPSQCHGDLTLENIIVKNDKLYLIDFLDSFYDSWVIDIGTLLQDVQVMWSYRFDDELEMNTVLRLKVFKDLLIDRINSISSDYVRESYYMLLLKLLRIFPYVNDDYTYDFLIEKTNQTIDYIFKIDS